MNTKTIYSSWMELNGFRLDSGPYLSGAIEAKVQLEKLSVHKEPLHRLTREGLDGIFHAGRESRTYVYDLDSGVPFLGSTDILAADLSWLPLLSKKQVSGHPRFTVHKDWILITRSGTVGRMAYVRPDMAGMACSEHVIRVVSDTDRILPGYLYAYLNSRFGVPIIVSGTYGAVIQHIEPQHLEDLPVPRFNDSLEKKVHDLVSKAAQLRSEYQAQVKEATTHFFNSVGLRDISMTEWHSEGPDLGFSSNINSSVSLRAINFNPRFRSLQSGIKSVDWRELGEICLPGTLRRAGRYKRIDAEPAYGVRLIGQKQLFWQQPEGRYVAKSALGPDVFVEPGTILVAAIGTLGESEVFCRSEFIWGIATSMAYSENVLRVVANEQVMPRGCLYAFMRSETAFRLLRSIAMGSKQQELHYTLLPHMPVPYPDRKSQRQIDELVTDAYEKRHHSNSLEQQAIQLVENAITGED